MDMYSWLPCIPSCSSVPPASPDSRTQHYLMVSLAGIYPTWHTSFWTCTFFNPLPLFCKSYLISSRNYISLSSFFLSFPQALLAFSICCLFLSIQFVTLINTSKSKLVGQLHSSKENWTIWSDKKEASVLCLQGLFKSSQTSELLWKYFHHPN